eukprot:scaffold131_cov125-Cylindrotheca_fusiformis.AAC.6
MDGRILQQSNMKIFSDVIYLDKGTMIVSLLAKKDQTKPASRRLHQFSKKHRDLLVIPTQHTN